MFEERVVDVGLHLVEVGRRGIRIEAGGIDHLVDRCCVLSELAGLGRVTCECSSARQGALELGESRWIGGVQDRRGVRHRVRRRN